MTFIFGAPCFGSSCNKLCGLIFILGAAFGSGFAQDGLTENQDDQSITIVSLKQELGKKPESDVDRIQGSWQMVLREYQGKLMDTQGMVLTIEGNQFRTVDGNGKLIEAGTIALSENESPKADDTTVTAGFESDGKIYRSIYRIKGDTYQTCVNVDSNGERPKVFYCSEENTNQLVIWRRMK